jgi:precorrin-6Y C5,15-methyltransferase (decarboxylating)
VPDRPTDAAGHRSFGNPDEAFLQSKPKHGLLTPAEIRSIALAEMDLGPRSIVWDIGAGSGSVSIEAAHLASSGTVYAIEMDAEEHTLIVANAERFRVSNVVPVLGRAPDAWKDLPHPDAVFVDGSGREVSRLVEMAFERLRPGGRLVTNAAGLESVASVHETLKRLTGDVKVLMINLARGTEQLERLRFEAANPVFLVSVVKAAAGAARKNSPRKDQS